MAYYITIWKYNLLWRYKCARVGVTYNRVHLYRQMKEGDS
jgi:hypothetical protein